MWHMYLIKATFAVKAVFSGKRPQPRQTGKGEVHQPLNLLLLRNTDTFPNKRDRVARSSPEKCPCHPRSPYFDGFRVVVLWAGLAGDQFNERGVAGGNGNLDRLACRESSRRSPLSGRVQHDVRP